jgi:hypothetical protein
MTFSISKLMTTAAITATLVALTGCSASETDYAAAPPPPDKLFASSAEVTALMAKAASQRKDDVPTISQNMVRLAP